MTCDSDTCAPQPFWPLPPKKTRKTAGQCPRSKLQIRSKTQKKKKKTNQKTQFSLFRSLHRVTAVGVSTSPVESTKVCS